MIASQVALASSGTSSISSSYSIILSITPLVPPFVPLSCLPTLLASPLVSSLDLLVGSPH